MSLAPAPVLPGERPVRFTVQFDRTRYLLREPMWVEWQLENTGSEAIEVSECRIPREVTVEFQDKSRSFSFEATGIGPDLSGIPFRRLKPGESMRGYFALHRHLHGVTEAGQFSVQAKVSVFTRPSAAATPTIHTLLSSPVKIEIAKPDRDDLEHYSLIEEIVAKDIARNLNRPWATEPGKREPAFSQWPERYGVCHQLAVAPKPSRYRLAAQVLVSLYSAQRSFEDYRYRQKEDAVARWIKAMNEVIDSPDSSAFQRLLARYYLMYWKAHTRTEQSLKEIAELEEKIRTDAPHSPVAEEATALLAKLKATLAKP